ncbi:ArsR/SmtB family transcription factor [Commensalibacter oyaizuii]|uniref:Metalloregulator ArsR/SmtB family transcription factor n=1 Tax=Commensalibacter oyaizuii TaxID=3043873 RepID=A0ABT6Q0L4_9PROT|nr:metalloregulator ArsR/SmtB family transcription factor [Commensalibacter sp. TBRC 16381]MDI2090513.1 metalloregulator ArsR/SmtB family transcription factor [Commensalibacter sp. TBRC 16381]
MEIKNAITALAALAQESRLAIFRTLIQAGPEGMPAGQIGQHLQIPPSSLSFHLKELVHANMIIAQQEGRFIIYQANFKTAKALIEFLTENCCAGHPCDDLSASCSKDI